ncbi:MAG: GAF domain-containing protein [Desulfovibrionaceae bacterium]
MKTNPCHKHVLSIVCSVFDAYSAVLFLPSEQGEHYEMVGAFSLGDKVAPASSVLLRKGIVGWILRNRQPLLLPNFDQRRSHLGYYEEGEEASIKAFMGWPIPSGGALCVDSKRQYSFSDKDYKILQLFAELISKQQAGEGREALAGDIPRYFAQLGIIQDLRFHYKRWPAFLQNFLRTLAEATNFEYCAFASIDDSGENYTIEGESARLLLDGTEALNLPTSSGIVGWVFRDEQPVFSEGTGGSPAALLFGKIPNIPNFQAVICMPVVLSKSTRGVLCLANTQSCEMDEALRSFVRQCVDHLALFLENLYLKNRLRGMLPKAQVHSQGSVPYDADKDFHSFKEE